jgi:hypothetical protein
LGVFAVTHVHGRDMMYTVIVPFALTYWGLAIGLFLAMGVQHFRMVTGITAENEKLELAANATHMVFSEHEPAREAIESLLESGVAAKRISVVGTDCDAFRFATTALHVKKLDKLIVMLGSLGFAVGAGWGILCAPALSASLPSVVMSAFMAAFSGAVLGALAGAQIGAVLRIDGMPATEATILSGTVKDGVIAVFSSP